MKALHCLPLLFLVAACATPEPFHHEFASGHYSPQIESCVPYVRRVSDVKLSGNAHTWWEHAKSHYRRGHQPEPGAVLVLRNTSRMRSGHVAMVRDVLGPREITVTHSNWGDTKATRHIVYDSMLAEDVSPHNDWSQIRFWNDSAGVMGFPYAAYGFIYPHAQTATAY